MDKLTQQKIEMWTRKLEALEAELEVIIARKGAAALEGDLRENAAYQMAEEDADVTRAKIEDVKKIIKDLHNLGKKGQK